MKLRAAVAGASGYIGGEITRLLLLHPNVEVTAVTGNEAAGKPLEAVHPNLTGTGLVFQKLEDIGDVDVLFLALPNGEAMKAITMFPETVRIIDASADFRLRDKAVYEKFYKAEHTAFERTEAFVYGSPELFEKEITSAQHVAAPGCFATATILALYPLVAENLHAHIAVSAVTGSSGAGVKAKATTHHPFRADSYFSYETFTHRHIPEIRQALETSTSNSVEFVFQPHSGPFVRGIFVTAFVMLREETTTEKLREIYATRYEGQPFVRLQNDSPNIKWVRGTNFCDISVRSDGRTAIVHSAIDNVLKGGASQAVECFNLMHGLPRDAGLRFFATNP